MMRTISLAALALLPAIPAIAAEPEASVYYGFQAEQAEIRVKDGSEVLAFEGNAFIGTDELKLFWRNETEYELRENAFERLENQARLQIPVSTFFDAVAGIRVDTPDGPDRVDGVIGLHGLAPQWFELDVDLFVSDDPVFRVEAEYEGLITNRITLTPSLRMDLPLTDDRRHDYGAFAPDFEIGARLSYDLVDRAISPYIGVHYEFALGDTADRIRAAGGNRDDLYFVAGTKIMF